VWEQACAAKRALCPVDSVFYLEGARKNTTPAKQKSKTRFSRLRRQRQSLRAAEADGSSALWLAFFLLPKKRD
jgi:hypothetical protein